MAEQSILDLELAQFFKKVLYVTSINSPEENLDIGPLRDTLLKTAKVEAENLGSSVSIYVKTLVLREDEHPPHGFVRMGTYHPVHKGHGSKSETSTVTSMRKGYSPVPEADEEAVYSSSRKKHYKGRGVHDE